MAMKNPVMVFDHPKFEDRGYFEGCYDHHPALGLQVQAELDSYMIPLDRWDITHARPEVYGFSREVEKAVPKIRSPYKPTNTLKQIGLQYQSDGDRTTVPDAYSVLYSRVGVTRPGHNRFDVTKHLQVDILRQDKAEEVAETSGNERWQRVLGVGERFGNAVLAFSVGSQSYRPAMSLGGSRYNPGTLRPVSSAALAQAVFETVYFW